MNDKAKVTNSKGTDDNSPDKDDTDSIAKQLEVQLQMNEPKVKKEKQPPKKLFEDLTLAGLVKFWKEKQLKNIVVMVGAGISTSAGIPDFRSPKTGLYNNLQKYKLACPMDIFTLRYFDKNPKPFFTLAKELYPGCFEPTPSHYFVRLLHEKGLLLRHYTQNIDTLERIAGVPDEKLVEAHGSFHTGHCRKCRKQYTQQWMKEIIFQDKIPKCNGIECNGVVKPDIVFFGENLPEAFYTLPDYDFKKCDLLIIMGTSLEVWPFKELVTQVGPMCPRLLINLEPVGKDLKLMYGEKDNVRDVAHLGTCDEGVMELAKSMDWETELKELIQKEKKQLTKKA